MEFRLGRSLMPPLRPTAAPPTIPARPPRPRQGQFWPNPCVSSARSCAESEDYMVGGARGHRLWLRDPAMAAEATPAQSITCPQAPEDLRATHHRQPQTYSGRLRLPCPLIRTTPHSGRPEEAPAQDTYGCRGAVVARDRRGRLLSGASRCRACRPALGPGQGEHT